MTTTPDDRMAEILASGGPSLQRVRQDLRGEASDESEDLLGRLNALEFVDSLVGHATDLPARLGDYEIRGLLGRGGMGTVYAAYQPQLDRDVALKVLSPAYSSDPTMRKRFQKEAKATAALHHQFIVPIYDYGEAGGLLFFAMEKVDGVSLDRHIAAARRAGRPALDPLTAARRFAGVADALGHAHKRRILHRDVKPGNLLVHADGTLALADFGLSKSIGEQSRLSQSGGGSFLGTLLYASPEQALGRELSPASDLYSVGVAMFEAVTGELPLQGKTTESMLEALLHGTPRRLRDVMPKAPKDLAAVIDKLLQKEPTDRYADGEELARDLLRVADGEPVRIRRQWALVRAWRRVKKHPGAASAISVSIAMLAVSTWLWIAKEQERKLSEETFHSVRLQQAIDEARLESGHPAGPAGLLEALVGAEVPREAPASRVWELLAEAERLRPGSQPKRELEAAYDDTHPDEPLRQVGELLRSGAGREARAVLDHAIQQTLPGQRESVTSLWLYRYHVARAVAALTAAVALPEKARNDLIYACVYRHGAFFPRLLQLVLEHLPAGAGALLAQLDPMLKEAPPGARPAAGWLLVTIAGLRRCRGAQMMDFGLSYGERRRLHLAGLELIGDAAATLADATASTSAPSAPHFCGLEAELAAIAQSVRDAAGDRFALQDAMGRCQTLLRDRIESSSVLQCWGFVVQLLQEPNAEPQLPTGETMAPALQVAAFARLLRLGPPPAFLPKLRERIQGLLGEQGRTIATAELRSLVAITAGTAAEIREAAGAWFELDPESPEPLLARFDAHVRLGDVDSASADAATACQLAVDRAQAQRALLQILDRHSELIAASAADWTSLRQALQQT